MEIHEVSKTVVRTGNEIGQYLNIGCFAGVSHKPKENRAFCPNSDYARKLRTPTSCSDLKFFKLFFFLCIILEKSKKENPPKRLLTAPPGDPKESAQGTKPDSGHLMRKRRKGGKMAELSSASLLVRKFNLLV